MLTHASRTIRILSTSHWRLALAALLVDVAKARMASQGHGFSDVPVGAGVGVASGMFAARRCF